MALGGRHCGKWPTAARILSFARAGDFESVPAALFVILQNNGQEDWVPPLTGRRFIDTMRLLAGGTEFVSQSGTALLWLSTALGVLGAHFGLRSRNALHSATMLVIFWLLFPIGALAALSLISPIFVNRYLLMCIPALILLVSFALDRLLLSENIRLKWAGAVAGSMIFVLSSSASFVQYHAVVAQTNPFRDMTQYIATRSQPDDAAIFFTPSAHLSFIYYASFATSNQRKNLPKIVFPNFGDTPSGAQPIPSADEIRSATKGYRRVWLVLNFSSISYTSIREAAVPVIWSTLLEEFDLSQREQIGVFLVSLFVRK